VVEHAIVLQDPAPASEAEKSQEGFFGWQTAAWMTIPVILAILLAMSRRKKEAPLAHVGDVDFEDKVLRSDKPVLVHFYRTWSIGDRVMINQARRLAERNGDALAVYWLDGRCLFHCEGVVDEADVHREMWEAHAKALRKAERGSVSS
jgi:hypothetical protein